MKNLDQTAAQGKGRILYLDVLNIMSAVAVIFLHSTGNFHSFTMTRSWVTSCFAQCALYWAVPVFVMCTGATLFDYGKKYDTPEFFRKRVSKVVIPLLFWSVFFIVFKFAKGELAVSGPPAAFFLNAFFSSQAAPIYYFLFTIIGVYLTLPVLTPLAAPRYRSTLWYAVIVMFVTQSVLPVAFQAVGVTYNSNLSILFNGYLIHVILGYLLSTQEVSAQRRYMVYAAAVLSVLLRFLYTWKASFAAGEIDYLFSGYAQFHAVLSAAAVFLFVKQVFSDDRWSTRFRKNTGILAGYSFGVFLLHREILAIICRHTDPSGASWQYRLFGALGTYVITLFVVAVLKKIPGIRKLVP